MRYLIILFLTIIASASINAQCTYCFGSDATLTANPAGGVAPYTYDWSNGQTTQSITVTAGTYTVDITDANGCMATASYTVSENPELILVCSATDNTDCTTCNGTASVAASGGSGTGYMYAWSNGGSTALIGGLCGGTYTVTVTDSNGCTNTCQSVVMDNQNVPTVTITCTPN